MASEPQPRTDTVLVDDSFLEIFRRRAEQQMNVAVFFLGLLIGAVYGVAVTFHQLHG